MNKHLLETRLKSIKHYKEEIDRLHAAILINKETVDEIEKTLVEFFPFESGDIIYRDGDKRMLKIASIKHAQVRGDSFEIVAEVHYQDNRYGFIGSTSNFGYTLEQWNQFKKIGNANENKQE